MIYDYDIFLLLLNLKNLALKMMGLWPKLRLQGTTASRLLEAQRVL